MANLTAGLKEFRAAWALNQNRQGAASPTSRRTQMRRPGAIGRNGTSKRDGAAPSAFVRRTNTIDDFRRRPASGLEAICVIVWSIVGF
jgi:hypothetical protein